MKKKSLKHISYLLFILLLSLNSCVNETIMMENELDLETTKARSYPSGPWTKLLINYQGSTQDRNAIFKVETMLQNIYDYIPDMRYVIDNLVMMGLTFRILVDDLGNNMKSWYNPSNPPAIGFNGNLNITTERLLHELLHMFAFNTYDIYRAGTVPACEEYEVRVLTDLFMRRYFKSSWFEYQGMKSSDDFYDSYITWLDEILYDANYNIHYFKKEFVKFGVFCIGEVNDENFNIGDFNNYTPLLVMTLWFYDKN